MAPASKPEVVVPLMSAIHIDVLATTGRRSDSTGLRKRQCRFWARRAYSLSGVAERHDITFPME